MSSKSDKTYPLMLDYIPEEYVKLAQEELNETAEKTVRFIRDLTNRAKGMWNVNDISFEHLNRLLHVTVHQSLRIPLTQIKGCRAIFDFEGTSMSHLKYASPSNLKQVVQMYLECNPARYKSFHMVNCTVPMRIAYNITRPFLTEKLRKRVIFHKHVEELLEYFPKCTLPVEYGGDLKDYYMYSWMKEANHQMGISTLSGQPNIF